MVKLGFSVQGNYGLSMDQVMTLLAEAGFSAISLGWKRDEDLEETVRLAKAHNLELQSLHGPVRGIAALWNPDPEIYGPLFQDFMQAITDCAKFGAPLLVVHSWYGKEYTFCKDTLYFDNFEALVAHGTRLGVSIAFEHLEGPEYFAALMDHFKDNPDVGFCWDSGHECCYNPGWDFLRDYGDRLIMTHLNDNLGVEDPGGRSQSTDDLHLIPGDGIIDWDSALQKLKASRHQEILNLELKIRPYGDRCRLDLYSQIPIESYFREAYQKALGILGSYFEESNF